MSFLVSHRKQLLGLAALAGYMLLPVIYWNWLLYELESGAFPTNADSIGIPMAGFLFLWIVVPIFTGGIIVILKLREKKMRLN